MPQSLTMFRTANSTFDEGREFACHLDQAAEGFFRFMLGRRTVVEPKPPKTLASLKAVLGVMPRLPLITSFTR